MASLAWMVDAWMGGWMRRWVDGWTDGEMEGEELKTPGNIEMIRLRLSEENKKVLAVQSWGVGGDD